MARRYLITGASRGVGLAVAEALVGRGDDVVGCSRSGASLTAATYEDLRLDVTDAPAVTAAFTDLRGRAHLPDVVLLGAGMAAASPALFQDPKVFEEVLRANVLGAFLVAREALRGMMRTGFGRVIFVSSINTRLHSVGGVAYNASKAAVEEMAMSLAQECRAADVTVNAIGLSLMEGDGMAAALTDAEVVRKSERLAKPSPVPVSTLVHTIDFLAAPEAAAVTGQCIFFGGPS